MWWHGYKISWILAPLWTSRWSAGAVFFAYIFCAAAGIAHTSVLQSWSLAPCPFTDHCELGNFSLFLSGLINASYFFFLFLFLHWVSSSLFKQNVAVSFSSLLQKCFCNAVFTVAQRMFFWYAHKFCYVNCKAFSSSSFCWSYTKFQGFIARYVPRTLLYFAADVLFERLGLLLVFSCTFGSCWIHSWFMGQSKKLFL